ncbi:MAG: EAL domain-containing protein [Lachnospiraceae bacterium]|nr:EAL domain-containing protein [Lachnospiraceae bacterium]
MYTFSEEMRKNYESSPLSFVYYQNIDGKAVPVLASDGFCRNTGIDRGHVLQWLQTGMYERMHPDDVGMISRISNDFLNERGPYDVIFRCRLGGEYVLIHGGGRWQEMPDGPKLALIQYLSVSEAIEGMTIAEKNYDLFKKDVFYTDSLTGLPNLNYLHEYGEERIREARLEGKTTTVIFTDVYSMQSYNLHYGVKEGDELLRLVGREMKAQLPDALVIRAANDHFIVVTDLDSIEKIASGIEEADDNIRKKAYGVTSGIRCGICQVGDEMDVTDALDHARHALRRINNDMTRTWAVFSQEADNLYWRERYIIEHFDKALENGWIKIYYQAITRVSTGKISSFEALARWIDPVRGMISPGDFIPVLQQYHQLYKLDIYMFEQVCREFIKRHENNLPLTPVSVNFSRQDFDHVDVVGKMNRLYEEYGIDRIADKSFFIVEITEQDLASGPKLLEEQMREIHKNGYRLWLDDFGSGYSAINMFSRFSFDLIKFDMELLKHLDDNGGANRVILREMMNIARKLGSHTLVEGVENEEQLEFMRQIGCELVQGYYYHKPEPLDDILFRTRNGMKIKMCETRQERDECERVWMNE